MIGWINSSFLKRQAGAATLAGWWQQLCAIGGVGVTIPVVIDTLGNKEAGLWFSLQGLIAIFSLSDFGFSMAISRQVAHSFKVNDGVPLLSSDLFDIGSGWDGLGVLYSASRTIFVRVMLISIFLFIISYQLILPRTNLLPHRTLETALVWYLLAGSFALLFLTRLSQSFLDGLGYMYIGRGISGFYQLVSSLLSIVALRLNFGLTGLAAALLIASSIQLWAMHSSLNRVSAGKLVPSHGASGTLVAKLWKVSVPFGITNTGGYLVGAVQVPMLGALLGPAAVAPIYIAFRISQALNASVLQIVTAQLPFFTQQCAQGHWMLAKKRMLHTLIISGALQVSIALGLYFASPGFVDWWVGAGHYIAGPVLLLFSINYALTCLAGLPAQFVLASGRNPFAVSTLIHGVLTLTGMVFLCPRLGLLGLPLSGLLAIMATNFWLSPLEAWKTWHNMRRLGNSVPTAQGA